MKIILATALAMFLTWSQRAEACGCFAPPNAAEPVVQAGERILFAVKDGKVTAHIQIQYAGDAKDFGWLLPLPSVPTLRVSSDEIFNRLNATTQPQYLVRQVAGTPCPQTFQGFSCGCNAPLALIDRTQAGGPEFGPKSPVVVTSSVGPYDYAVLRADDKTAMLQWLSTNNYFVPAGTDDVVGPYIRPGGYFLALKLKAGARTGDVTPVMLEYPSALPMIPLILTSVGATPNMGIQVFLLGNGRAIPRNFHHVVINDGLLDWLNGAENYNALVTKAVAEAPQKHAFVTEYAATSAVMRDQLVSPGRFGIEADLARETMPGNFVGTLVRNGFAAMTPEGNVLPSPVIRLLLSDIPYPPALASRGIDENKFLLSVGYYLGTYRDQNPTLFEGYVLDFDAPSLARQIFEQYVTPLRETNALFNEFPTLTRLFTTLNPEDMTEDPVFSFNPQLPEISGKHDATLISDCGSPRLVTEQGWIIEGAMTRLPPPEVGSTPVALRVEVLREEGLPTVVTDNQPTIHERFKLDTDPTPADAPPPANGCSTIDPMSLGLLAVMWLRRRGTA